MWTRSPSARDWSKIDVMFYLIPETSSVWTSTRSVDEAMLPTCLLLFKKSVNRIKQRKSSWIQNPWVISQNNTILRDLNRCHMFSWQWPLCHVVHHQDEIPICRANCNWPPLQEISFSSSQQITDYSPPHSLRIRDSLMRYCLFCYPKMDHDSSFCPSTYPWVG